MQYINKTMAYKALEKKVGDRFSEYEKKLQILENYLDVEYKKLSFYFSQYTAHDWQHTIPVLNYMYELLEKPEELSEEGLMIMICAALLHDIGMAYEEEEAKGIFSNESDKAKITEMLRAEHGKYAREKVRRMAKTEPTREIFVLHLNERGDRKEIWEIVGAICESHTKPFQWIQTELGEDPLHAYIAYLLCMADLLDIDSARASRFHREAFHITGLSGEHFYFNSIVGGKEKIRDCDEMPCNKKCPQWEKGRCGRGMRRIELNPIVPLELGSTEEAKVRRMISDYKDNIETTIREINTILKSGLKTGYRLLLAPDVELKYEVTKPASEKELDTCRISVDYASVRSALFSDQLYPNRLYGIREVVQNAYDACKAFMDKQEKGGAWIPTIMIHHDPEEHTLSIRDNGIGMTNFVIREYFLNIGKSIYNCEPEYQYGTGHADHIGHFGLGFYAVFMLSDCARIRTKSYQGDPIEIEINKSDNYATVIYHSKAMNEHGTEVVLNIADIQKSLKCSSEKECLALLRSYIEETFLEDGIQVLWCDGSSARERLELRSVKRSAGVDIGEFLKKVDGRSLTPARWMPPIFYAETAEHLKHMNYDELLEKIAKDYETDIEVPYLDSGSFLVFAKDQLIRENWNHDEKKRINYSKGSILCADIPIDVEEFCDANRVMPPHHSDIKTLFFVKNGRNDALCEMNAVCSSHIETMLRNDACGEAQEEARVYLRDVRLPSLRVTLPFLNFRYQFGGIVANIKTDHVFPTLVRDTLADEAAEELNTAIGYAIALTREGNEQENAERDLVEKLYLKQGKTEGNRFIKRGIGK